MKKILAAFFLLAAATAAPAATRWWDPSYRARREVTVYAPLAKLPGDDCAIVTIYTGGHMKPDGSDIRVVTGDSVVPHKLYGVGPGDKATLAFKVERGKRNYHIYFGNDQAEAPGDKWEPQRGLILETRGYKGGGFGNLAAMRRTMKRAGPFYGAGEVDRVWHGHNLFGPTERFVSEYVGWLVCTTAGTYHFATSSDCASFLLVNNKLVVAWPGWHGPVADARHSGRVTLTAGIHCLAYLHVNGSGASCAVAAWRTPTSKSFEVIPRGAFAPLSRTAIAALELASRKRAPDFDFEIIGEALLTTDEPDYAVKIRFRNRTGGAENASCRWDFGDGLAATGAFVDHIYLAEGIHTVTMTLGTTADSPRITQRIHVHQHWGWQTRKEIDDIASYFAEISTYDLEKLQPSSLAAMLKLAADRGSRGFLKSVALTIVARNDGVERRLVEDAMAALRRVFGVARLIRDGEILKGYSDAFRTADGDSKAALAIELSDILLELGRAAEAGQFARAALAGNPSEKARRKLLMVYAETAAYVGDAEAARRSLEAADAIKLERTSVQETAMTGALALVVEDFLARKQYDEAEEALEKWEWESPLEKLVGYSSYLGGRLYAGRGRVGRALREFASVVAVSPESPWAPRALLSSARLLAASGEREQARRQLRRITAEYMSSPEVNEAEELLETLGND